MKTSLVVLIKKLRQQPILNLSHLCCRLVILLRRRWEPYPFLLTLLPLQSITQVQILGHPLPHHILLLLILIIVNMLVYLYIAILLFSLTVFSVRIGITMMMSTLISYVHALL